jgi:hypothetical protein
MARLCAAWTCVAFLLVFASACNRRPSDSTKEIGERYIEVPGAVGFDIEPLATHEKGASHWLAIYRAEGKTAKLRIEFDQTRVVPAKDSSDFSFSVGEGRFVSESGSDASVLLRDLQRELEAKKNPKKVTRLKTLPFTFVEIGGRSSQASGGGFNSDPPGNWITRKIFLGEGEHEGEVFLNINPVIQKGQFSIKHADYGDTVIGYLSTVL